jgi:type I restriction enzyme S subunit
MAAMTPLAKVLQLRREYIEIDDVVTYKRCRVQLHAQGIVLRDIAPGWSIKTKRQQVCRAGDFLVAEIDAKVGGFGIVPEELEGAVVSSHYFLFGIDETKLDAGYLALLLRTREFQDQVTAKGSTNYAAIRPSDVLGYLIPLPPLREQEAVVRRVQAIMASTAELRGLQQENRQALHALGRSLLHDETNGAAVPTPMGALVALRTPDVVVESDRLYRFAGVYSFGRGVFPSVQKLGREFSYLRVTRLREGEFVYPKLMAWEGAFGVVPAECEGLVVSPEYPVFELNRDRVLPETMATYFSTPDVWLAVAGASKGTNVRRRRLHPSAFMEYRMPLPSMDSQRKLREVREKTQRIEIFIKESLDEVNAVLPSLLEADLGREWETAGGR